MQIKRKLTTTVADSQPIADMFKKREKLAPNADETKKINRAVAEFLCTDMIPIYCVEKKGFKNLIWSLNPRYELPGRRYFMENEIPRLYDDVREAIRDDVTTASYFSCTTDCWTSRNMSSFMSVTAQLISSNWELKSWCLGCFEMLVDHTADELKEALYDILDEWNLDKHRLAGITTDNASNNVKAFANLQWLPCFGHNLDLSVNKALQLEHVSSTLGKLRKTVSGVNRSTKRKRKLLTKQVELGLPQNVLLHDVSTRWGSTQRMIQRFLEQQNAVSSVLLADRKSIHLIPGDADLTTLETVNDVLEPLQTFTDAVSGDKQVTSSVILPLLWKIFALLAVSDTDSESAAELKQIVAIDMETRYADADRKLFVECCTFLDPRFKESFVANPAAVKTKLRAELAGAVSAAAGVDTEDTAELKTKKTLKTCSGLHGLLSSIKEAKSGVSTSSPVETPTAVKTPKELFDCEVLLYESMAETEAENDPLSWWKGKESTFPVLAQLAKKYLCISATSCSSERVFSTSGYICNDRRNNLSGDHLDMLVFLAQNLPRI